MKLGSWTVHGWPRAVTLLAFTPCLVVYGHRDAASEDAPTLADRAAAIERVSQQTDGERVVVGHMSRTLAIPVETLRAKRAQTGLTWGELFIADWLVQHVRPGLTLEQVVADLRGGLRWEDLAATYGADVAALTAAVERSQTIVEPRAEDRSPSTDSRPGGEQRAPTGGRPGGGCRRNR